MSGRVIVNLVYTGQCMTQTRSACHFGGKYTRNNFAMSTFNEAKRSPLWVKSRISN